MTHDTEADKRSMDLKKLIEAGVKAETVADVLIPILDNEKKRIVDKLENGTFYYQKIDNSELLTIHLELKVIRKIKDEVLSLISVGAEAREKAREQNEPKKSESQKRYRF